MAKETKLQYWPLIEWSAEFYSDMVNVDVVKPPYSPIKTTDRIFLQRRKWYVKKDFDVTTAHDPIDITKWSIVDTVTQWWFTYYLRVRSDHRQTALLIKDEDSPCTLRQMQTDCLCSTWFTWLVVTDFVKWVPRQSTIWWSPLLENNTKWILKNKQVISWSYAVLEWRLANRYVTNGTDTRNWNWADFNSVMPWDYVYIYDANNYVAWWQVNRVLSYDATTQELIMEDPWNLYPWVTDTTWSYISPPDLTYQYVKYGIFPDYWETVAYNTCDWVKVFAYDDSATTDPRDEWVPSLLPVPSLTWSCYTGWISYTGQNGVNHFARYDWATGALLYTLPWIQKWVLSWFWYLASNIIWLTSFQNYWVYFGKDFIGAFYIVLPDWSTTFSLYWNKSRDNLWIRQNADGSWKAYTEYGNSLYFVWSNWHIYSLSIQPTQYWTLAFTTNDLTDDGFCKYIIGDICTYREWWPLRPWDDVYLQADDDDFKVFINHKTGNGPKTKILTYNKRYKLWTKHYTCCGKISWRDGDEYYGDSLYMQCWDVDCKTYWSEESGVLVEWLVRWYLGDDISWGDSNRIDSFSHKQLDRIKTQIGRNTKSTENTVLRIYSNRDLYKPLFEVNWFEENPYVLSVTEIAAWATDITVPKCTIMKLKAWETFDNPCEWSAFVYPETETCECADIQPVWEHCICIEDKKYFLADFVNLHTNLNWMEWNMFIFELRFTDNVEFGWVMTQYKTGDYDRVIDCEKRWAREAGWYVKPCDPHRNWACA